MFVRSADDLAARPPQGWELLRCAASPPFLAPPWLQPSRQVFHPGELRSVAVTSCCRKPSKAPKLRALPAGLAELASRG